MVSCETRPDGRYLMIGSFEWLLPEIEALLPPATRREPTSCFNWDTTAPPAAIASRFLTLPAEVDEDLTKRYAAAVLDQVQLGAEVRAEQWNRETQRNNYDRKTVTAADSPLLKTARAIDAAWWRSVASTALADDRAKRFGKWLELCGTRERYARCSFETFTTPTDKQARALEAVRDYAANLAEHFGAGAGLLLFGPAGTGKTHLLAAVLRHAMLTLRPVPRFAWTSGVDVVLHGWRAQWCDDALAIDDPVVPRDELKWDAQRRLHELIDNAYQAGRPILATVNVGNSKELTELVGAPVADRLRDNALAVHCDWPTFRRPLGVVSAAKVSPETKGGTP